MIRAWIRRRMLDSITTRTVVRGIPVTVINTRAEIETKDVVARLDAALALIEEYTPEYFAQLRQDFAGITVCRQAYRGAYLYWSKVCVIELTFTVNPEFTLPQVAAVIVHEAMHARLHRLGFSLEMSERTRQERFCRRAEIKFGRRVPGGDAVVERAYDTLVGTDDEITVYVDEQVAQRRVREVDLQNLAVPRWLKRVIARREGLTLSFE